MIPRLRHVRRVEALLDGNAVVALLGARQVGRSSLTRSMHVAADDLHLDRLDVVHPGRDTYELRKGFRALSLRRVLEDLDPI